MSEHPRHGESSPISREEVDDGRIYLYATYYLGYSRKGWLNEALSNEIVRSIIVAVFATLYELERKIISERIKAGVYRAKAAGKHMGRRLKLSEKELKRIKKLCDPSHRYFQLVELLGIVEQPCTDTSNV